METCAAVSRGGGRDFSIETFDLQAPAVDEVLVRIVGVGLCHSDLWARDGIIPVAPPAVLGHEGAGVVVAKGSDVTLVEVGDNVVLTIADCDDCRPCRRGDQAYCDHAQPFNFSGGRMNGSRAIARDGEPIGSHFFGQSSFATFASAYERNAVRIDRDLPLEIMGPLGCGVQTGAGAVINGPACREGSSILIPGGGSVGLSAVLGAVLQGCATIVVSEPHTARRMLELGATHVVDPRSDDVATGVAAVIDQAVSVLGPRRAGARRRADRSRDGGARPRLAAARAGPDRHGRRGVGRRPQQFIPLMLEKYRTGLFPFDRLVTKYPLEKINEATEDHDAARCVKAVLIP